MTHALQQHGSSNGCKQCRGEEGERSDSTMKEEEGQLGMGMRRMLGEVCSAGSTKFTRKPATSNCLLKTHCCAYHAMLLCLKARPHHKKVGLAILTIMDDV